MGDEMGNAPMRTLSPETTPSSLPPPPSTNLPPRPPMEPRAPKPIGTGRRFPVGTAIIALVVVLGSVGALFAFSGAKVAITPTESPVQVEGTFTSTAGEGELPFEIITVEKTATNSIAAESTQNVTQAAQGVIVISNSQDASQALIKNTRFETPEGLVFRIKDSINVPKAANGQPGQLSVTVYADEAGEKYNVGATTFTLPGLKGSDTYTKVTARSSDAMKGGYAGARPTVSQATKDAEMAKLETTLDGELKTELATKVKEGYVLIPGATASTFEPQPDTAGAGNTVALAERGVVRGVIFPEEALARTIAYQSIGTYSGQPLTFKSLDGLKLAPSEGLIPNVGDTSFSFTLTGTAVLVWKVDTAKVGAAVAGKSRSSAESVLQGFPEVEKALLVLKPFWQSTFPANPAKITVTVEGAEPKSDKK